MLITKLRVVACGRIKVRLELEAGPKARTPGPLTKTSTVHLRDRSVDAPVKARPLPTDHIDLAQCSITAPDSPMRWRRPAGTLQPVNSDSPAAVLESGRTFG